MRKERHLLLFTRLLRIDYAKEERSHFFNFKGILETSIVLVVLYAIFIVMVSFVAKILSLKKLLHTTYRIFMITIVIQFLSNLFTMIEYAQFSSSGVLNGACGFMGKL